VERSGATIRIPSPVDRRIEKRIVVEATFAVLVLLSLIVFYKALLGPQVAYASDRVELMYLRELWAESAPGFGLRDQIQPREYFLTQYRGFRSRPTVRGLIQSDETFAALVIIANKAFDRLEMAEIRGQAEATQAALEFDKALEDMANRVGEYAKKQLDTFRGVFLLIVAMIAAVVGVFIALELRLRALSIGEKRNQAFSRALIAAQEGERLRISRELHDAVAQDLAAAKLYCGLCESPEAGQAVRLLERAIDEVRNICYGLRPAELDRLGITEASGRLCSEIVRETGIEIIFSTEGLEGLSVDAETEINLYRILQEALANVRRHSGAKRARVTLAGLGNSMELRVEDDGNGSGGKEPGLGRTGMEERARMIGGQFRFGSGPWGGTTLSVIVPARGKESS
jgi:signal transduction histidine kinase